MVDWTASMEQTFKFYVVDPVTWKDTTEFKNVKTATINRDASLETLGSATFDVTESVGECYIRAYLITVQNGVEEKHALGTFMVQTPTSTFDGRVRTVSMDAYTPLLELKEKQPAIGYYVPKGNDVMEQAHILTRDNTRTPVNKPAIPSTELSYDFIADTNDTWLTFISDLLSAAYVSTCYGVNIQNGEYVRTNKIVDSNSILSREKLDAIKTTSNDQVFKGSLSDGTEILYCVISNTNKYKFDLDEMGRILFVPEQDAASLRPVWTYNDDNSSILHPSLSMNHDMYGIPNVVEVLYSDGNVVYYSKAVNDDPNSPISTDKITGRGREIVHRVTNPTLYGSPTQERVDEYAEQLLRDMSSVEYTITYTHGYCPVRVGDCVRLNYTRAGLKNIKAKVISQSIKCEPGCPVTETAVFTNKLWR